MYVLSSWSFFFFCFALNIFYISFDATVPVVISTVWKGEIRSSSVDSHTLMANFLLYLITMAYNTASCQKNERPIETTPKIWYSVGSGPAAGAACVLSKLVFQSVLDVFSRKGPQGEIRVYRSLRLTVLFNILEFGFRTKQKKRVLLNFYTNFNRLLNVRVRNIVTLTLIFHFWPLLEAK